MVRGFQQVPESIFRRPTLSTTSTPTWRVLLALAATYDLEVEQIDFIGAFLNAGVDLRVYMEVPKGLYEYSLSSDSAITLLKKHGWDPSKDQVILLKKSHIRPKTGSSPLATKGRYTG